MLAGSARVLDIGATVLLAVAAVSLLPQQKTDRSAALMKRAVTVDIDYPRNDSVFPPGMSAPRFVWRAGFMADSWQVQISFEDRAQSIVTTIPGEHFRIGSIDQRCIAPTNKLPQLTAAQAASWVWRPDAAIWGAIQMHSVEKPATIRITGLRGGNPAPIAGQVRITTSKDRVGAPIFYRDVPLMPTMNTDGTVQPIPPGAVHLINWRIRNIREAESHTLLTDVPTCLNCHSFSANGKTMGIDLDGPNNDKGLYAITQVQNRISIDDNQVVQWNTDGRAGKVRVGFMSQVSPDGRYVLSTFSGSTLGFSQSVYVRNFADYRFLQVFYPTKGILEYYDRTTGRRQPLPGADDPAYVQTGGFWSPDGKWIVFSRAKSAEPYAKGRPLAKYANDPNETKVQYDLYRVPFNEGRGGKAEPIAGASQNGMSNNFPKVSPDGKWIVFVECRNGEVMRPDSQLYIVPSGGGTARRLRANLPVMNSWHSWSPNGRWLVFASKGESPYTQMYLTHIDAKGDSSPAVLVENATESNRAVNLPEFLNAEGREPDGIEVPAIAVYRMIEKALDYEDSKDFEKAERVLEDAVKAAPDDARLHNDLAAVLYMRGETGRAIEEARTALRVNPSMAQAHFNLGATLMQDRKFEEAIAELEVALNLNPGFGPAEEAIAQSYDALRRDDVALTHWRRAIDANSRSVWALVGEARILAGSSHAELRNGREAVRLALRAKTLTNGTDATVLDTLSAALAETGQFAEALATAQHALDLATGQGDVNLQRMIAGRINLYRAKRAYRN